MSNAMLEPVLAELRRARGLDLSAYRRATLERRLAARLANLRLKDLEAWSLATSMWSGTGFWGPRARGGKK